VDIRRELYGGIVLTGGTAGFATLRDRLEKEVADLAPQMAKVKVGAARWAVRGWVGAGLCCAGLGWAQHCVRGCADNAGAYNS
jgi:actin-related protein